MGRSSCLIGAVPIDRKWHLQDGQANRRRGSVKLVIRDMFGGGRCRDVRGSLSDSAVIASSRATMVKGGSTDERHRSGRV